MNISQSVTCKTFHCLDIDHHGYMVPAIDLDPEQISIIMVSESAPASPGDYYYAGSEALFAQTTLQAFNDAGAKVTSMDDILNMGIYLTTAVKCSKTGYGIQTGTVKECSFLLEKELALFPNVRVLMLMGDVAIKAVNEISRRAGGPRVIPAISTYKLRGQEFYFQGKRVFPSYLQAGPSFFIEKSKRRMIADDIAQALNLVH
jgi:uracil-DNA glycosylase